MCGKFHIKLNIGARPIANKYREGKMKRTLERELKVPEIAEREALRTIMHSKREGKASSVAVECDTSGSLMLILQVETLWAFLYLFEVISISWGGEKTKGKKVCLKLGLLYRFPCYNSSSWLRIKTYVSGPGLHLRALWEPRMLIEKVLNDPSWNTDQGV